MLFGLNRNSVNIKFITDKNKLFQNHKINWYYAGVHTGEYYKFKAKDIDITKMIWSANTVSIYALIFAIYMGFKEIYLLGMDHNYMCKDESEWRFYKNAIHQKDEIESSANNQSHITQTLTATGQIFEQYQKLKDHTTCKVFNTSRISLLDIFEVKKLQDII